MSAVTDEARRRRPLTRAPEPAFFWVRHSPRRWPPPGGEWLDLAAGTLGAQPSDRASQTPERRLAELDGAPFDDTVWLPPVPASRDDERRRIASDLLDQDTPILWHLFPGAAAAPEGAQPLYDLTPTLVAAAGDGDRFTSGLGPLTAGAAAVWPLIPGVSDDERLWRAGCAALVAAGATVVQGTVPSLTPADRRRLAEGLGEAGYHRLFHTASGGGGGPGADRTVAEAAFARAAEAAGLDLFVPRPLPAAPAPVRHSRRVAEALYLAAELWLRLDRPPSQGQALFRAARWVDESSYDPVALAREGNLGVVDALDEASRKLIEDTVRGEGRPALLEELGAEYTAPPSVADAETPQAP